MSCVKLAKLSALSAFHESAFSPTEIFPTDL